MSTPTRPLSLTPERLEAEVTAILRTLDIVMVGLRDTLKQGRTRLARRPARLAADLRLVADALNAAGFRAGWMSHDANPAPRCAARRLSRSRGS